MRGRRGINSDTAIECPLMSAAVLVVNSISDLFQFTFAQYSAIYLSTSHRIFGIIHYQTALMYLQPVYMHIKSAIMQQPSWNDLRVFLAISRARSLSGAAALLGVNPTTISRRLKLLEDLAGSSLFLRDQAGNVQLSPTGLALADQAEGMERYANLANAVLDQDEELGGTVRLTAVPFILNRIIFPNIRGFSEAHPKLAISLIPDNRYLSLTRREVDIAIRFGKPREGGDAILAQRIGKVTFSVYTATMFQSVPEVERPWLTYDSLAAHLSQAKWTETLSKAPGQTVSKLLMHDLESAYEMTLNAPFRAVLPDAVARKNNHLVKLEGEARQRPMFREVWLLRHRDMKGVCRIDAMMEWLTTTRLFE